MASDEGLPADAADELDAMGAVFEADARNLACPITCAAYAQAAEDCRARAAELRREGEPCS